jgi:hypothetical protein
MSNFQASARYWKGFGRSAGLISAAILSLLLKYIMGEVAFLLALFLGFGIWIIIYFIRQFLPADIYMRGIWHGCVIVVFPISFWLSKWLIIIVAGIISILTGTSFILSLLFYGGLIAFDFFAEFFAGA